MKLMKMVNRSRRILFKYLLLLIIISYASAQPAAARSARVADSIVSTPLSYADIADLATAAPLIMKITVSHVQKVKIPAIESGSTAPNYLLVRANVESLIRGDNGVAPEISFLVIDPGKHSVAPVRPKRGMTAMLFARPGQRSALVQMVSRNAFLPWTADLDATSRTLVAGLLSADPPPVIASVGDAFHTAGTIAGESETQIFLKTQDGAPVSLSILHRPGQAPRWGVSLGEIVDDSAVPPAKDTLLWYRLACGLPSRLPANILGGLAPSDARAAESDYQFVMESLGSCGRTL